MLISKKNNEKESVQTLSEDNQNITKAKINLLGSEEECQKFQQFLRSKLKDCGWSDQIKLLCETILREKGTNLNAKQLLEEVSHKAREMLPPTIKHELLDKVREHILTRKDSSDSKISIRRP